jgi:hypothetical protein
LAAAPGLTGCGGEEEADARPEREQPSGVIDISGTEAVGEYLGGSVASLVECRDWNEATPEQRLATIDDVRSQVNRQDAGIRAPALTDGEAQRIFDAACEPAWAGGLRLYKIYTHAAGFAPLARALEQG